jgi:hypothetical protein
MAMTLSSPAVVAMPLVLKGGRLMLPSMIP